MNSEIAHPISTSTAIHESTERLYRIGERCGYSAERLYAAVDLATLAHAGQHRSGNGLPYVTHPIAVAVLLAEAILPEDLVVGALLHDVKQYAPVLTRVIASDFGPRVDQLVSLLTKDATISDTAVRAADARARIGEAVYGEGDIEAGMIKIADRVHKTFTSGHLWPDKQVRLANEAMSFYAPMARFAGWADVADWLADRRFFVVWFLNRISVKRPALSYW